MSYPDKFPRDDFHTHINITHLPSGYKFYQQAGRIVVLQKPEGEEFYRVYSDFTTTELQIEGTWLTEDRLRRAAIVWLKDNLK
jgi:hypothetical protein